MPPVIVSLASYPPRIESVQVCIESLLSQSVRPEKILLWLYAGEFPHGVDDVPASLVALQDEVFSIEWTDVNLKPHNKYFWTMQRYPEAVVVTTDDDIAYMPTMLEELLQCHREFPRSVVGNRTHIMLVDERGALCPYGSWLKEQEVVLHEPSQMLIATGVGGVLYPPQLLPAETFDIERIRATVLRADDLWLKAMEIKASIPTVATGHTALNYIPGTQDCGLWLTVNQQGGNDEALGLLASFIAGKAEELKNEYIRMSFQIACHYEGACRANGELGREIRTMSDRIGALSQQERDLRARIEDIRVEKAHLDDEVHHLRDEVSRLVCQGDDLKVKLKSALKKNKDLKVTCRARVKAADAEVARVKQSWSYRVGRVLVRPLSLIKRAMKCRRR